MVRLDIYKSKSQIRGQDKKTAKKLVIKKIIRNFATIYRHNGYYDDLGEMPKGADGCR